MEALIIGLTIGLSTMAYVVYISINYDTNSKKHSHE